MRQITLMFCICIRFILSAAPEIKTISVSVSNAVSGAFETIPITFRFGETNGVVERLEGDRFVPVLVAEPKLVFALHGSSHNQIEPELRNINRLKEVSLPEINLEGGVFYHTLSNLIAVIHQKDTEARIPIEFSSSAKRTGDFADQTIFVPEMTIPSTNAMDALYVFLEKVSNNERHVYRQFNKECPEKPTGLRLRKNEFMFIGPNWDYGEPVTRAYSMPVEFLALFKDDDAFTRYLVKSLTNSSFTVGDDFEAGLIHEINKVRIRARSKVHEAFERLISEPCWAWSLLPDRFIPCVLHCDDETMLYLRGRKIDKYTGLWKYEAVLGENSKLTDKLIFCEVDNVTGKQFVTGPAVYEAYDDVIKRSSEEVFVLRSSDGLITRMEGNLATVVRLQKSDAPWFGESNNLTMYTNAVETLKRVIIPDCTMRNQHVTNGLAMIQTELSKVSNLKLTLNIADNEWADQADENGDPFAEPDLYDYLPCPVPSAFSARNLSAYDSLKLLLDIANLYWTITESNTIEVVSKRSLDKGRGLKIAVTLPANLLENKREYDSTNASLCDDVHVGAGSDDDKYVDWIKGEVVFCLNSRIHAIYELEDFMESLYTMFPNRYKLENKTVNGRPELYLIESYRNITRRYRSWMEDGQRRERFEIVK